MAKKRTGLQSDISSIFSGVPVPKKESTPPKPADAPVKPAAPPAPPEPPVEPADVKPPQPATTPAPAAKPADKEPPKPVSPPVSPAKPADTEPPKPAPPAEIPKPVSIPKPAPVPKPEVTKPSVVAEPVKAPAVPAAPKIVETKKLEPKVQQIPTRIPRRRKDKFASAKPGVSTGRQKASIVMVVILSIALVVLLGRPYLNSRSNPVVADTAIQTNAGTASGPIIEINWPDPPPYQPFYRDPMDPESNGTPVPTTTQGIVVTGIVYSEDNPRAIIDRQYYGVGDKVKGADILKITRNNVTFERDGETWTQGVQEAER